MMYNMPIDAGGPRVECTRPGVDMSLLAVRGGLFTCLFADNVLLMKHLPHHSSDNTQLTMLLLQLLLTGNTTFEAA